MKLPNRLKAKVQRCKPACRQGRDTKIQRKYLALAFIVLLGAFLRFYKLDWGGHLFFHPDEYHIASAVSRISFPNLLNPELFSYGSFTVYLIHFTQILLQRFSLFNQLVGIDSFASAILIGRFYSALFSTLTILLVYFIAKRLFVSLPVRLAARLNSARQAKRAGKTGLYLCILVSSLAATLPGSIQQAHFATPESILTFWLFLTLLMSLRFVETKKNRYIYLAAASQGLALGTKIVAFAFLPVVFLPPIILHIQRHAEFNSASRILKQVQNDNRYLGFFKRNVSPLFHLFKQEILLIFVILFTFFLSFPYAFLDYQGLRNSMSYEGGVAQGEPLVFYTRQFIKTTPALFQLKKVFPYALGPGVLVLGIFGFLGILSRGAGSRFAGENLGRKRKLSIVNCQLLIVVTAFLCYFLPNVSLFAKWTRFMAPIFPFFAIFTAYFLSLIANKTIFRITYLVSLITTLIWTVMFFSIYLHPDVRITTTEWMKTNLPPNSFILTESGNMIEVPVDGNLIKRPINFYNLEDQREVQSQLSKLLPQTDFFVIQSRRIFANHQRLPKQFLKTANFYNLLFNGQLGFTKIKEFSSFPGLNFGKLKFEINDEVAEETWSVFDHPVIRIYEKVKPLTNSDYEKLLKI